MNYKKIILLLLFNFIVACEQTSNNQLNKANIEQEYRYKNSGFALVSSSDLEKIKLLDERSLNIYHKILKKNSLVKIINPTNNKYIIAQVKSNRVKFSNFYNSVLSSRIADELELDLNEPYIEIISISKNSTFVAKKAKMFDEEKTVAEKGPGDGN